MAGLSLRPTSPYGRVVFAGCVGNSHVSGLRDRYRRRDIGNSHKRRSNAWHLRIRSTSFPISTLAARVSATQPIGPLAIRERVATDFPAPIGPFAIRKAWWRILRRAARSRRSYVPRRAGSAQPRRV